MFDGVVGVVGVLWQIYYCQQDEVCLYKALRFDIPIATQEETTTNSEGVEVVLQYTVVPSVVKNTGFEINRK